MTDTIDVAALVERLRVDAEYLQRDFLGSTAHMIGERAEQAATVLQAQADALAEAKRALEKHAKHLAWVHATGVESLDGYGAFVEGYGPVKDMGITAKTDTVEVGLLP